MAPRGTPKSSSERPIVKSKSSTSLKTRGTPVLKTVLKAKTDSAINVKRSASAVKMSNQATQKTPIKPQVQRKLEPKLATPKTATTKVATPKTKENSAAPGSVTRSAQKQAWKRRQAPAHSGVPIPEKMKKLQEMLRKKGQVL